MQLIVDTMWIYIPKFLSFGLLYETTCVQWKTLWSLCFVPRFQALWDFLDNPSLFRLEMNLLVKMSLFWITSGKHLPVTPPQRLWYQVCSELPHLDPSIFPMIIFPMSLFVILLNTAHLWDSIFGFCPH